MGAENTNQFRPELLDELLQRGKDARRDVRAGWPAQAAHRTTGGAGAEGGASLHLSEEQQAGAEVNRSNGTTPKTLLTGSAVGASRSSRDLRAGARAEAFAAHSRVGRQDLDPCARGLRAVRSATFRGDDWLPRACGRMLS